jgi:hypothetical protein
MSKNPIKPKGRRLKCKIAYHETKISCPDVNEFVVVFQRNKVITDT